MLIVALSLALLVSLALWGLAMKVVVEWALRPEPPPLNASPLAAQILSGKGVPDSRRSQDISPRAPSPRSQRG